MTTAQTAAANPFALMMDPDAVFAAIAGSDRLARLHSRICRPLDKPLPVAVPEEVRDPLAFDDGDDFGAE